MKIFAVLSQLLNLLGRVHLRSVVCLLGLALILSSWRPSLVEAIDKSVFRIGSLLMEAPKGATGIVIVEVPVDDISTWQSDINQAGNLGALLSNILHTTNSVIGIVLEYPIDARTASADLLLDEIAQLPSADNASLAKAKELSQRKSFLLAYLRDPRVVVGVYDRRFPEREPYSQGWGVLEPLPSYLKDWLWPYRKHTPVELLGSVVEHHPVYPSAANELVLISANDGLEASGSFTLHYLEAIQKVQGVSPVDHHWQRDVGVALGALKVETSADGKILPIFGASKRMSPSIERISFEEAMARGAFPPRVYIAAEGSELAQRLATSTFSIEADMTTRSPWWYSPLEKALLLILTVYSVLLLPRMSGAAAGVVSVFAIFVLLVVQVVAQATQKLWLPFGLPMLWLISGHLLIVLWAKRHKRWQALVQRADSACIDQARHFLEKGEVGEARRILEPCEKHNKQSLDALYDVSNAYASKRQYQQAIDVLQSIEARKRNFRDVREKLAALQSMLSASEKPKDFSTALDSTVVLDTPQIEKPVLGRYEIREELGRGAMGTVYLAFDPKIARQVAVKTLSYHQFQGQQLDDIKSRFFREAEAAGRLSHPNIVSVFDVGEEHDMAFIAMDFAEGKPLSAFVNTDNLLPLFEVYRIVADVAQALAYAHANNIVHRDIKPGNIMYNPAPYQLMVTDFGIARLVDNSKTSTGEILGSPLYMAPEQLKGKKVNHYADIFSLGVTFYQLLTGQLPFQGENLASLTYEIIHGKHKSPKSVRKDLPSSAARIINQALQKDAEDRYASAADMATVVKKAIKRDFAHEAKRAGYL